MVEEVFMWFHPEELLIKGGLLLLLFIVFAESGLYFGFFFPGDSLLFAAGVYCGTEHLPVSVAALLCYLGAAAVLGYSVGFGTGKLLAGWLMKKNDGLFFRKRYIHEALDYYRKRHHLALVLARFLPVFRTFIPIVSGMINIPFRRFTFFNVLGAAVWISTFVLSGYFLRKTFPQILSHLEIIILSMVAITAIPVVKAFFIKRKNKAVVAAEVNNNGHL